MYGQGKIDFKRIVEKEGFWLIGYFFLSLIILVVPYLIRSIKSLPFIGVTPYYYLTNSGINLYQFLIHLILEFKFIPVILGTTSLVLFYLLIRRFYLPRIAPFFLLLSPAFIYTFTFLNQFSLAIFLLLLGLNLLLLENKIKYISFFVLLGLAFFDFFIFLISFVILIVFYFVERKKVIFYSLILVLIFFLINLVLFSLPLLYEPKDPYLSLSKEFFSDTGSRKGFGLFFVILALIGFFTGIKKKENLLWGGISFFLLIIYFFTDSSLLYLNFFLAVLASQAFSYFSQREGAIELIKNLTLAVLIFGLFFSSISYLQRIGYEQPENSLIEALGELKKEANAEEIILSHPEKGFWIKYFANRTPFVSYSYKDFREKERIASQIFYSYDFRTTFDLLEKHNITYIFIDEKMKEGQVWLRKDEGLLSVLKNERFDNVYRKNGMEIWEFERED